MERIDTDCKRRAWKTLAKLFKMRKSWRSSDLQNLLIAEKSQKIWLITEIPIPPSRPYVLVLKTITVSKQIESSFFIKVLTNHSKCNEENRVISVFHVRGHHHWLETNKIDKWWKTTDCVKMTANNITLVQVHYSNPSFSQNRMILQGP